ncbi:hypothetical protein CROQUDRAFT_92087 [Cronartium quercuum f. sp. fusiforme G11]|uniref:Uncharacterized protein n=1 Tax=Cronartium quercuum f. sp. fusiforme G11 TaxID=708437 RepID=A0A9P6TC37_9BASI|nr:hypothetical protein CROQUDRAFT_92087 [Cronartium quercuum f. sp. fusiforme G11]
MAGGRHDYTSSTKPAMSRVRSDWRAISSRILARPVPHYCLPDYMSKRCEKGEHSPANSVITGSVSLRDLTSTPSTTKPHAAVTEANACASSLELGGERVVINHRAPPSQ